MVKVLKLDAVKDSFLDSYPLNKLYKMFRDIKENGSLSPGVVIVRLRAQYMSRVFTRSQGLGDHKPGGFGSLDSLSVNYQKPQSSTLLISIGKQMIDPKDMTLVRI